ncbi:MAG: hypothetical protein CVU36_16655 [Betaproteobacteria bacterium HGW-Betaproteobacteria-9]|nr:MAG: hypothetical protein CVU36_16655 [Betaproteobacteria bacterium HGW-Betaproteobacteria-9]
MTVERYIRIMAALTAFAGFNLFQSGITGFCPPGILFKKLGVPEGGSACRSK